MKFPPEQQIQSFVPGHLACHRVSLDMIKHDIFGVEIVKEDVQLGNYVIYI